MDAKLSRSLSEIPKLALKQVLPNVDSAEEEQKLRTTFLREFEKRVSFRKTHDVSVCMYVFFTACLCSTGTFTACICSITAFCDTYMFDR